LTKLHYFYAFSGHRVESLFCQRESKKLIESGTMATEMDSIPIATIEPTGTTASEISGTMATETIPVRWHYISETDGTISVKWLAQWRANYPL
jgi:hypothetical protein